VQQWILSYATVAVKQRYLAWKNMKKVYLLTFFSVHYLVAGTLNFWEWTKIRTKALEEIVWGIKCSLWNPYWNPYENSGEGGMLHLESIWKLLWGNCGLIDFSSPLFCTSKYGKCAHSYKFFIWNSIVFRYGSTQESQSASYGFHTAIHMQDIRRVTS
jgi:hypothetical protein